MHIGSLPGYLRGIEKSIPLTDWKPGDCVVHNHPYYGASHSPDIAIVMPVFFEGELVGFSANTAHMSTLALQPRASSSTSRTSMPRACCSTASSSTMRACATRRCGNTFRDNTRVPGLVMGDLEAQIASAELGVQRFIQLMEKYGKETVLAATRQLMDYTESMLRREIAKIPDGDYVCRGLP